MAVPIEKRHITVAEYYRMAEDGLIAPDERVELIEGEIVHMSPIGDRHANCVRRLLAFVTRRLGEAAIVDVQDPVRVTDESELQPDLVVLRPRDDFYTEHPGPGDILLIVEVSETSHAYD